MTSNPSTLIQSMRTDLRERRTARAEYRALKAALATYNSPAEIDDLLFMAESEGEDAAALRDMLGSNLQRHHVSHTASVSGMHLTA